jgi:methyl-accepting chemotaxis protein
MLNVRMSIRRKINFAILLLVLGFVALGVVAVPVLKQLAAAVTRADALAGVLNAVTDAQVAVLTLADKSHKVDTGAVSAFIEEVKNVEVAQGAALDKVKKTAGDTGVGEAVAGIEQDLRTYANGMTRWALSMDKAGFDAKSGLRAETAAIADQLVQKLEWMSALRDFFYQTRDHEKNFFLRRSPEFVDRFQETMAALESKIDDLKMQDFEVSPGVTLLAQVRKYAETFAGAAQLTANAWQVERDAAATLAQMTGKVDAAKAQMARVLREAQLASLDGSRKATWAILGGGTSMALILTALLAWVGRGTVLGLHRTADLLRDMAMGEGDLTMRLPQRLITCSELLHCEHRNCPSHGAANACWSSVGSLQARKEDIRCEQLLSGQFESCGACAVYQKTRDLEADELDRVAHWFNTFIDKVRHVVARASEASAELAQSVERLSSTTSQIAVSNEETSSQSQVVAASAEEMSATVGEVARSTALVSGSSEEARRVASEGNAVISQALEAMAEIASLVEEAASTVKSLGKKSDEISVVLEVIEDIADQTNLLALNAAIEAARAGEHGRGFAVVADEVRKLAEKTMKATDQISGTISAIQSEGRLAVEAMGRGRDGAEKGGRLSGQAGEAVAAIETGVTESCQQAQQIATAAEQLLAATQQIAASMDEMAKAVGQNSAAATEIADNVRSLAEQAGSLRALTATFRT